MLAFHLHHKMLSKHQKSKRKIKCCRCWSFFKRQWIDLAISMNFLLIFGVAFILKQPCRCESILDQLLTNCWLDPSFSSPAEITSESIPVTVSQFFQRLISISDVDETFTVMTTILMEYPAGTCVNRTVANSQNFKNLGNTTKLSFDFEKIWTPKISHTNSQNGMTFESGTNQGLNLFIKENVFNRYIYTVLESQCNLDLWLFPFDRFVFYLFSI